eukprot:2203330-Karenia_brevis.AAC.1
MQMALLQDVLSLAMGIAKELSQCRRDIILEKPEDARILVMFVKKPMTRMRLVMMTMMIFILLLHQ